MKEEKKKRIHEKNSCVLSLTNEDHKIVIPYTVVCKLRERIYIVIKYILNLVIFEFSIPPRYK